MLASDMCVFVLDKGQKYEFIVASRVLFDVFLGTILAVVCSQYSDLWSFPFGLGELLCGICYFHCRILSDLLHMALYI